jgi:pSer/pThr/pTyr-binding forkhead associated (FHA) protein
MGPSAESSPERRAGYRTAASSATFPPVSADASGPRVYLSEGSEAPRSVPLAEGRTTFGRDESCEVTLADAAVSTNHLEISVRGGSLLATDLDSSNGTILNGTALDRPRRLRNGDVLQVGPFRLEVAMPPQLRHDSTIAAAPQTPELTGEEREVAKALVRPYRDPGVKAGRPATRAEVAGALNVSERTVQRRLDALAFKLRIDPDAKRERPRLIAERVIELGLDR